MMRFVYLSSPEFSNNDLSSLHDKKEVAQAEKLDVDQLVDDSNDLIEVASDRIDELPAKFQDALHDNIVQYFLTSADRYDTDSEIGLDAAEFASYGADMLVRLNQIIDKYAPTEEQLNAREEQRKAAEESAEAAEAVSEIKIEDLNFNPDNLKTPEGIQTELKKLDAQSEQFRTTVSTLSGAAGDFQTSYTEFEASKQEWSVFLRGGSSMFGFEISKDPETTRLEGMLETLKADVNGKIADLRTQKDELAGYGAQINQSGDALRTFVAEQREDALSELDSHGDSAEGAERKNEQQYQSLESQRGDLVERQDEMAAYMDSLYEQAEVADEAEEQIAVNAEQLEDFDGQISGAIETLDKALSGDLPDAQRKELEAKRDELLAYSDMITGGLSALDMATTDTDANKDDVEGMLADAESGMLDLNTYLFGVVMPAFGALDAAKEALGKAKLSYGTQREQAEAQYAEKLEAIGSIDASVAESVLGNNLANEQVLGALEQQKIFLDSVSIDRPTLWTATGGLLLNKVGEGISLIGSAVLEPIGDWMMEITEGIPVINTGATVVANIPIGLVAGVLEGCGELVQGVNMIIDSPIRTLEGMGALIGRDPMTNEWSLSTAGTSWKEMGKALLAWDDFAEGDIGKGIGKVGLNLLLTATGAGAAIKGSAKAATVFTVARGAGSGVMRAGLVATGAGIRVFAVEFSSGLANLPGEAVSGVSRAIKAVPKMRGLLTKEAATSALVKARETGAAARQWASEAATGKGLSRAAKQEMRLGAEKAKYAEAYGEFSTRVEEIMSADAKLTRGEAIAKLYKTAPELVEQGLRYEKVAGKLAKLREAKTSAATSEVKRAQAKVDDLMDKVSRLNMEELRRQLEAAKAELKVAQAREVVAQIEAGVIKGFENYKGIRDLGKQAGLTMEEQLRLTKSFLEHSGAKIDDLIDLEKTVGPLTSVEVSGAMDDLTRVGGVDDVIARIDEAKNIGQLDDIVAGISSPVERELLRSLSADLKSMVATSLDDAEKVVIFKESMRYLSDYKAAMREGSMGSAVSVQDVFDLIRGNQRRLAHQTIVDRKFFTGSDHGVTHILEANMAMADKIFADMGTKITPQQKILIRQAILDHDMGYTISALDDARGGQYFGMTKDHPLYSTVWVESHKAEYVKYFGEEGYEIIRDAILDHSNAKKLDLTASGGQLVQNIVAGVDCLGTTADIKMMKLFREPEMMAKLMQLKELADEFNKAVPADVARIRASMKSVHEGMLAYVERSDFPAPLKDSYRRALTQNFDPMHPEFAFKRDFGSHSAGFEGLSVGDDGAIIVDMSVNENFSLVRDMFANGDDVSTSALAKAMDDYGLDVSKSPTATVTRDGVTETVAYSQAKFAEDLARVERGEITTLSIETPRAKFNFGRNAEKGREVATVLRRERAISDAIRTLENPEATVIQIEEAIDRLSERDWTAYTLDGRPAAEVLTEVENKMLAGQTTEASLLLRRLRFEGVKI